MNLSERRPTHFQYHPLPLGTALVGLAALVHGFDVRVPVRHPACVSDKHVRGSIRAEAPWQIYDKRYEPGNTAAAHLTFALRHESLDLLVLKRIFQALPETLMTDYVRQTPTGTAARRAWFFYEFLTGRELPLPEGPNVAAVALLDPKRYYTLPGQFSRRHKVVNNLLGTPRFCPMIQRTKALQAFADLQLATQVQSTIGRVSPQLVARAASFLLMADSQASFAIEGERPPKNRLERWGQAVLQAGKHPLTLSEILWLHSLLLGDHRFVQPGLRPDGVFIGDRTAEGEPLPEFIGAKPEDLENLMAGLIETNTQMRKAGLDPVLQATATAFGFVYIHPFQDGNGRLHRCLIHHVLAERGFSPPGLVFPVSSVMQERIEAYRATLQNHSSPLLPYIAWRPTPERNVEVLHDTADIYRYFDATGAAEFIYACIERTITYDLPRELDYLRRRDEAVRRLMERVEMPDRLANDFLIFCLQHGGTLPHRRRKRPFAALTDPEVQELERIVQEAFDGFEKR